TVPHNRAAIPYPHRHKSENSTHQAVELPNPTEARAKPGFGSRVCHFGFPPPATPDGPEPDAARLQRYPTGSTGNISAATISVPVLVLQPDPRRDFRQLQLSAVEGGKTLLAGTDLTQFLYVVQGPGYRFCDA